MFTDENSNNLVNGGSGGGGQTATLAAVYNNIMNVKDSRWLQLEVCREFQRGQCSRTDQECKFAHPPPHVDVQNGKVTACYDSIKGRCTRENPKCKYLHPPQHLKDQLLINGRNNLAIKNMVMQQIANPAAAAQLCAAQQAGVTAAQAMPTASNNAQGQPPNGLQSSMLALNPNMAAAFAAMPNIGISIPSAYPNPAYYAAAVSVAQQQQQQYQQYGLLPALSTSPDINQLQSMQMLASAQQQQQQQQQQQANAQPPSPNSMQKSRGERVEVCREFVRGACSRSEADCKFAHPAVECQPAAVDGTVPVCVDAVQQQGACANANCSLFHPPAHMLPALRHRLDDFNNGNHMALAVHERIRAHVQQQNGESSSSDASAATSSDKQTTQQAKKRRLDALEDSAAPVYPPTAAASLATSQQQQQQQHSYSQHSSAMAAMMAQQQQQQQQMDPVQAQLLLAALQNQQQQQQQQVAVQQQQAAIAAQQQQAHTQVPNKRAALDKSGVPVYQPTASTSVTMSTQGVTPAYYNLAALQHWAQAYPTMGMQPQMAQQGFPAAYMPVTYYVEVHDGKVTVCRDAAKGKCARCPCKYYHVPMLGGASQVASLTSMLAANAFALEPGTGQQQQQQPTPTAAANGQFVSSVTAAV